MHTRDVTRALSALLLAACSSPMADDPPAGGGDVPFADGDDGVLILPDPVPSSIPPRPDAAVPDRVRPDPTPEEDGPAPVEADAAPRTSCLQARACARTTPEATAACLEQATRTARAEADAVLGCERGICLAECAGGACEACLLARCSLAFEACARSSGCGDGVVDPETEECDDGNAVTTDACTNACTRARPEDPPDAGDPDTRSPLAGVCGDGVVDDGEACDDGNTDPFDGCSACRKAADHVLISEIVVRPASAEMIELVNPTSLPVDLSLYALSDSAAYWQTAAGVFPTAGGTDFAARFPDGAFVAPGAFVTVALGSAASFVAVYGTKPDYELRPTANGAIDDEAVPNMGWLLTTSTIGTNAGLTDSGEPIVLFRLRAEQPVDDLDYVFYGKPSTANPAVDKTSAVVAGFGYLPETPSENQAFAPAPDEGSALHRCVYSEGLEPRGGNGISGHEETGERWAETFSVSRTRTPGGPPPSGACH